MTLKAVTANVDKATRGAKMRAAIDKPARGADIVAYQEVERLRHVKAVLALVGFSVYLPDGVKRSWRNACPIVWRDHLTRLDAGWVLIGKGVRLIQPNRVATWVLLRDDDPARTTYAVVSAHTVSGIWKRALRKIAAWAGRNRRQESDRELAQIAALAQQLRARADVVVVMGDLNRPERISPALIGCDQIVYASAPTHGRHWFDLIGLIGATGSGAHRIATPSDHDALACTVTPTKQKEKPVPTSQNGYVANDRSRITSMTVPGTSLKLAVRKGAPGWLLVHFAGWFNANVEPLVQPRLDDWGYAERPIRGDSTTLSNHASGTAIDLNATQHPMGKRGTFTDAQAAAIRRELRAYDGTIRWGGDYTGRPDEMHFEINASVAACEATRRKLQNQPAKPDPAKPATQEEAMADMRVPVPKNSPQYDRVKSKDHTVAVDTGISMLWYEVERLADMKAEDIADRVAAKVNAKVGVTKADVVQAVKDALKEGTK